MQQLKEQFSNQKVQEAIQQYESMYNDLTIKQKMIKDVNDTGGARII